MRTATLRAKFKTSPLAAWNGAREAEFPTYIEPCDPTLQQRAPAGEGWVYEIKADGFRAQLHLEDMNATVYSRTGLNWTNQFSAIAEHLKVRQSSSAGRRWSTARRAFPISRRSGASSAKKAPAGCTITLSIFCISMATNCATYPMHRKQLLKQVLAGAPNR